MTEGGYAPGSELTSDCADGRKKIVAMNHVLGILSAHDATKRCSK